MKKISIVTPAYNETECVDELARRLTIVFEQMDDRYEFEVIIVENGSKDDTYEKLLRIHAADPRFKILQLSRNFMFEGAVTAGLELASGDAVIIMVSDLQDPPELIPEFVREWENGYDIVYGIVKRRSDESFVRVAGTKAFYWLINRLSDQAVPRDVSDFRIVDRRAYEALNSMPERNRMLRAMWAWLGFRTLGIPHDRPPRHGGQSTYSFARWSKFAVRGIVTSSYAPLKVIPAFGLILAILSMGLLIGFVVRWFTRGVPFDGFGTIVALMLLLFAFVFVFLGVLSEYIGMIFEEVRRRPSYVVRAAHGLQIDARNGGHTPSSLADPFETTRR
jgi:dolichol-phosphate mannosyltransferase